MPETRANQASSHAYTHKPTQQRQGSCLLWSACLPVTNLRQILLIDHVRGPKLFGRQFPGLDKRTDTPGGHVKPFRGLFRIENRHPRKKSDFYIFPQLCSISASVTVFRLCLISSI